MSPFIDNKTAVAALFQEALFTAFPALKDEVLPFVIEVEKPKNPDHGHFAVNSALQLARKLGAKPRDIAVSIVAALPASALLAGPPEIAGPGFINIRLSATAEYRSSKPCLLQLMILAKAMTAMLKRSWLSLYRPTLPGPCTSGTVEVPRQATRSRGYLKRKTGG